MYEFDRPNLVRIPNEYHDGAIGQRTGFEAIYHEVAIGWRHYFSDDVYVRREVGYYHSFNAEVFSGGTRKDFLMVSADLILRY
jgi:hypothetical protein